jgi:carbon storage regulator
LGVPEVPRLEALGGLPTTDRLTRAKCVAKRVPPSEHRQHLGELRAMLVLSRKKNETIIIDDHIVITVVEIRGDKVRLGIEAPKEIPIHRSEVHAAIHAEQDAALPEHKTGEQDPPRVTSAGS